VRSGAVDQPAKTGRATPPSPGDSAEEGPKYHGGPKSND
jgi:hypothetical protein